MTRVLSELLGAREPQFSRSLQQLEILAGHPQADIRLSSDFQQQLRLKLRELGLDASDTTGPELYAVLGVRLTADEQRFAAAIKGDASQTDSPMASVAQAIKQHSRLGNCYALKPAVARRMFKANLPKKTMKALGYRSADSMLKHETVASLFAAAWLIESAAWSKRIITGYAKLQASDFEVRDITIEHPASKRWQGIGDDVVALRKHHVLSFKELGAVVLLPLPSQRPALATLTSTVLALRALNEIRSASTFLKLHQMQSHFGGIVQQVIQGEPMLPAEALDEALPWHTIHQYFARVSSSLRTEMFEPIVTAQELAWTNIEKLIANIAPALGFWEETAHLALQDTTKKAGLPVSCNLMDVLLSHANNLPFDGRLVQHFRESLRSELLLSYLNHDKLEQTIFSNLQARLAPEKVINERQL